MQDRSRGGAARSHYREPVKLREPTCEQRSPVPCEADDPVESSPDPASNPEAKTWASACFELDFHRPSNLACLLNEQLRRMAQRSIFQSDGSDRPWPFW